jgi:hypothetical protein
MHKLVCHVLSEEEILLEDKIQWIGKSVQYSLWSNKKKHETRPSSKHKKIRLMY